MTEKEKVMFAQFQPEGRVFHTQGITDTEAIAEEIAKLDLEQFKKAMKAKNIKEIKCKPCNF